MTNLELLNKIKAEIDRLYDGEAPRHDQQCDFGDGYFRGLATIEKFIDSLPEEKPSENLEKAARLYAIPHYMKDIDVNYIEEYPYDTGLEAAFIAGAEWQEKQDLRWAGEIHKNGYNLCKEQMMKDAVEIEVGMHGEPIQITLDKYVQRAKNIFPGEKVKLLIVKE